jgi:hypothetical protein
VDLDPLVGRASGVAVWRVFEHFVDPVGHGDAIGHLQGCEIEFWARDPGSGDLLADRWNPVAIRVSKSAFGQDESMPKRPLVRDVGFPIDIVYTWVDGDDPVWRARRDRHLDHIDMSARHTESASDARYQTRDELRYSLRSVEKYADFVRRIYIVTDRQRPDWLVDDNDRIRVVDHTEIFPSDEFLPTFNSHAIESTLHRIDGLSEHYLYMNDDFFFGRRVNPNSFFMGNGIAYHFLSRALIPRGDVAPQTKPVDAAAINGRALIEETFGVTPTQKFKHAPYPQLRTVQFELEKMFVQEVAKTSASRVRSPTDLAMASSLHHYVAYCTGRSIPGSIRSKYVELGSATLGAVLYRLLTSRNADTICVNDADLSDASSAQASALLSDFLTNFFPEKSSFER